MEKTAAMVTQTAALMLTLAIEAPIIWLGTWQEKPSVIYRMLAGFLPSLITHPIAWHLLGNFGKHDYIEGLWLVEGLVTVVEILILRVLLKLTWKKTLCLSFLSNGASFSLGFLMVFKGL